MTNAIQPFHLLVIALAGWLNRHQQSVIDYLIEENRVLKEQLEGQRLRFTRSGQDHRLIKSRSGLYSMPQRLWLLESVTGAKAEAFPNGTVRNFHIMQIGELNG